MTTASWSTRVRHDSDATYQEWRDEFITKLGDMVTGGFLAADETNITAGAGSRPGTNTEGGYAVYHLDDSLHATAPVYIRFGFGTNFSATAPRIQVTVGTSTNGSGVLGGTALATIATCTGTTTQTTDTTRQSYMCNVEGFLGFFWKSGSGSGGEGHFFIARTVDADGAITVNGAMASWGSGSVSAITKRQAFRYPATAAAYTLQTTLSDAALGMNPQSRPSSAVGSDIQVMMGWTPTPRVEPLLHVCGVITGELSAGGTFSATLVGATARTYIVLPTNAGPFGSVQANSTGGMSVAMIWE